MKNDPYQALRYPEFSIFLFIRFSLVMAWTMQFIVIEWQVYSITKDPLFSGDNRFDGGDSGGIFGFVCRAYRRPERKEEFITDLHFRFSGN